MKLAFEKADEALWSELGVELLKVRLVAAQDLCSVSIGAGLPVFSNAKHGRVRRCIIQEHTADECWLSR